MKERGSSPVSASMLAAFIDGEVTPSEAAQVEAALADSATTRRRVAELKRLRDAVSSPVPALETTDLVAAVRERIVNMGPVPRRAAPAWTALAAACLVAAAAVTFLYDREDASGRVQVGDDGEFRAKSGLAGRSEGARWASLQAYSVVADAEPQPLGRRLPLHAGLLFSYTNLGPEPFEYLMVFATDARGDVHWCHPAYQEIGTNPAAVRIRKGEARVPLAELVHLDLPPGPATLYALFSRRPLHVLEVEAWLHAPRSHGASPRWPETFQQVLEIAVEP